MVIVVVMMADQQKAEKIVEVLILGIVFLTSAAADFLDIWN